VGQGLQGHQQQQGISVEYPRIIHTPCQSLCSRCKTPCFHASASSHHCKVMTPCHICSMGAIGCGWWTNMNASGILAPSHGTPVPDQVNSQISLHSTEPASTSHLHPLHSHLAEILHGPMLGPCALNSASTYSCMWQYMGRGRASVLASARHPKAPMRGRGSRVQVLSPTWHLPSSRLARQVASISEQSNREYK
jgi:hypothetical protein